MEQELIDLPLQGRGAFVRAESVDEAARTAEVVWTTGATVRRYSWEDGAIDEELLVSGNAVRMDRLLAGAPFLNSHNSYDLSSVLGVVESARIEGGKGYATIRFSEREDVEPIWRDIKAGIIRNVSVGYRVHRFEIEKRDGQRPLYRAVDWEPLEISAVAIGADAGAHVRGDAPGAALTPCALVRQTPAATAAHPEEIGMTDQTTATAGQNETRAAPEVPAVDAAALVAAERQRAATITDLCRRHAVPAEREAAFLRDGAAVEAVRAQVLDLIAERDSAARTAPAPAEVRGARQDETETRRLGMEEALTAGLTRGADVSERARPYAGMPLVELAAVRMNEARTPFGFGAREELLRRAFNSTSDFPLLFENSLNKALAARYAQAQPTYRKVARQRSYQDFRDHSTIRMGDFPTLQAVSPEGGEIKSGNFSEAREKTAVNAYGVRVNFSRQMLVNDTLGGLQQVLDDRGMAVARFEEATFYTMMISGTSSNGPTLLETARQVFNTTDGTLASSAAAISVTSLSVGRAALRKRTSVDGNNLDLIASILLVGPDKETEAQQVVAPIAPALATSVNPFSGTLEVVTTAKITGNAWYLFAAPSVAPCFEWGLLDGYTAPRFRVEELFGVQGTSMTLEHDFGCGAIDFRGGFRNAGA